MDRFLMHLMFCIVQVSKLNGANTNAEGCYFIDVNVFLFSS